MSTIHATLTPGGDWEINVKAHLDSWRNHPKNFSRSNNHPGDKCKEQLAEPSTEPFLKQQPFAQKIAKPFASKKPRTQRCHYAQDLWLKAPKAQIERWLRTMQKRLEELGDKFEEVMGEPSTEPFATPKRTWPRRPGRSRNLRNHAETLRKPWLNLGWVPQNLLIPRRICPREPRDTRKCEPWWDLGAGTSLEPWRDLGGTFRGTFWRPKTDLPQRTTESPKLLQWLKTPKLYCCWGQRCFWRSVGHCCRQ